MERLFFHSLQICNLIARSKDARDGAIMAQEDKKMEMEILCKWMVISIPTGWSG